MEPTVSPQQPNTEAEVPAGTPPVNDSAVTSAAPEPAEVPETTAPVVNGTAQTSPPKSGGKKKWLMPAAVAGVLAVLIGGGYVFGMYLPNRPEAVFSKSMTQSGKAADKLIEYAQNYKSPAGTAVDGTLAVKSSDVTVEATMKGQADSKNADLTMDMNIAGQKATVDFRMVDAAQSDNPDMYLKVSGVKELLSQVGGTEMASLDSQWIAIDHTLMDTLQKQLESAAGSSLGSLSTAPTSEQLNDAMAKAQTVNKDYLFTTDKDKAVMEYKSFVGKETKNGRAVNHYKVGYSKAHLKAYVDAMGKALDSSKLNDWAKKQSDGKSISETLQLSDLQKSIEDSKANETFDLFVDTDTKLVQSVVFTSTSSDSPGTFTLSQNYTGGDTYPFELNVATTGSDKMSVTVGLDVNTKTNKMALTLKGDTNSGGNAMTLDMKANISPSDKKVTVTAPTGAKPITDILKQFGIDPSMLSSAAESQMSEDSLTNI